MEFLISCDGGTRGTSDEEESFNEWRSRLKDELERVDMSENGDDELEDEDKIATIDVRITWKTFEEEAKELVNQLERLRMQEVNKVKSQILKAKRELAQRLLKLDKQRHILEAQAQALSDLIPQLEQNCIHATKDEEGVITEIDILAENADKEQKIIESLKNNQMENVYSECAAEKSEALERLEALQRREASQLQEERRERQGKIAMLSVHRDREIAVTEEKIAILKENVRKLRQSRQEHRTEHERTLEALNGQLEKAERKSLLHANVTGGPEQDEHWFGCPVCLNLLKPPTRIFQCPEGHILCEECKENPAMVHCPQCR